jgi:hypothetical protein
LAEINEGVANLRFDRYDHFANVDDSQEAPFFKRNKFNRVAAEGEGREYR